MSHVGTGEQQYGRFRKLWGLLTDTELATSAKTNQALEFGCAHLEQSYGMFTRIDRTASEQEILEVSGNDEWLEPGTTWSLSESYCQETIQRSDGLLSIPDATTGEWDGYPAYESYGLESYLGATVVRNGSLYGTVCFVDPNPRNGFDEEEVAIVEMLSDWMSYSLEIEKTHSALKRKNERLERFASIVSHDLQNPLTVATGHLELARREVDNEHLQKVANAHDRIDALIKDLLTLARQGDDTTDMEPIGLWETVDACWDTVSTGDATLVTETNSLVWADEQQLKRLLENFIRNAVQHGGDGVTVTVGDLEDGFYIEDDGTGIPESKRNLVFESGYSTADDGTGFGLSIVDEIATAHGWEVTVAEGSDGGARFEIRGVEVAEHGATNRA